MLRDFVANFLNYFIFRAYVKLISVGVTLVALILNLFIYGEEIFSLHE